MADYTPPDDLIELRRDFLAAQERIATEGQREAWQALDDKRRQLAVKIQEHKYWREVDDPKAARKALEEAVKAGGDEPSPAA